MLFYKKQNIQSANLPKDMWIYSEVSDSEALRLIPKNLVMEAAAQYLLDDLIESEAIYVNKPNTVVQYLRTLLKHEKLESFGMVLLSTSHKILGVETLCTGTVDKAAIYIRNVVETILTNKMPVNAVVLFHNHPGGKTDPSTADRSITRKLTEALGMFDIQVLDHIIIGDDEYIFSEHGII
ncbi:DNA repair protein RadC (plasmid) [Aliivibrio salmonicida]|uniref:JAB domain-containing protein n=1 Tax=Aliivibrio salmonicida TaxID=40269 RepID=UPI000F6E0DEA|nr:JAB domain-containing protein [Aliivibrio salmonicida]AZL83443.1 DNA repair protein RadC [Aliivibrio salmonicida]